MDRHPDRARLVCERARNGLSDPPGGVRGELVAAAPVELLDRTDEPQRPFLDQVEEREPLVAVVLRDRDDQAQVRLDHRLLGVDVAALDALGELDLLRGGQQRVPARVPQEELQRVCGRLLDDRLRDRRSGLGLLLLHDLDPALLERAVDGVDFERLEPQQLDRLRELGVAQRPSLLSRFHQLLQLGGRQDVVVVDFDRRHPDCTGLFTSEHA